MPLNRPLAKHSSVESAETELFSAQRIKKQNKTVPKLDPILTLADFSIGCVLSVSFARQSVMSMKTTELPLTGGAGSCSALSGKAALHYRVP